MHHDDEYLFQTSYDERERSNTPPMFAYSTYPPPPEEMIMPSYGPVQAYRPMPTESYPEYLSPPPVPVTLPSMTHFSDAIKRETGYPGASMDEGMPPYMSYSGYPIPGVDLGAAAQPSPYDQMPHVSASSSSRSPAPITTPPLQGIAYHGRARC
jgi:hypothetical protein